MERNRIRAVKYFVFSCIASFVLALAANDAITQTSSQRNPDVSNKALITKSTPGISADAFTNPNANAIDALRQDGGRLLRVAK